MRYPVLALAAAGALLIQVPAGAAEDQNEVVIESAVTSSLIHRSPYDAPGKLVSITRRVSYADLDLVTHAGVNTLRARVQETAESICAKLNRMNLASGFDQFQCVRDAVRDAMTRAQPAIDAAEHRMRTVQIDPLS